MASHLKKSSLLAHMYNHYFNETPVGANSRVRGARHCLLDAAQMAAQELMISPSPQ